VDMSSFLSVSRYPNPMRDGPGAVLPNECDVQRLSLGPGAVLRGTKRPGRVNSVSYLREKGPVWAIPVPPVFLTRS